MKQYFKLSLMILAVSLYSCGGSNDTEEKALERPDNSTSTTIESAEVEEENEVPASERIDLTNKGVGPVKNIEIADKVDQSLADKGKEIYEANCTACHKPDKKFIGPAPKGVLERRTPEWVMNMIMNPDVMVQEDPLAKELLIEFNGSPMSNQGITREEARAMLEYMRTL